VEPTWYGRALIRRARSALSEIGRAHDEIAALRDGRMGQAAIGTVVNPGTNLIPQAIAAVKRDFPDILIKVEMDYSRPLVAKLLDGQLDIVVGRILGPEGAGELDFEPLADEPHAVIARAGHPLAGRPQVTHADLVEYGWIMPPAASVLRSRLDAAFLEQGVTPPQDIVETASLPVIIHLLRHSDLLTALPVESVAPYLQTGQMGVLPVDLGVRMEFFGIIRRRDQVLSPGAERVLQALRTTARRLYPDRG
ncbi:MAG TPA: LysR substrate-binding domain-containing protein, partial [Pseudoxanthomonas sp.]|nr:LysR substrate-binding domain-containing protein [Pseudoxanthomonas sp.]